MEHCDENQNEVSWIIDEKWGNGDGDASFSVISVMKEMRRKVLDGKEAQSIIYMTEIPKILDKYLCVCVLSHFSRVWLFATL